MKDKSKEQEEESLTPLNEKLYSEFSLQELEERLETDPLLLSSFFGDDLVRGCNCKKKCTDCTCDGEGTVYCIGQCIELGIKG